MMKGRFYMGLTERGTVRGTRGNKVRKHHKFMSEDEFNYIKQRLIQEIKRNKVLKTHKHVRDNVNKGKINYKEHLVIETLKDWKNCLIDYTLREDGQERIMLRSKVSYTDYLENKDQWCLVNQCAVINLNNMMVITAFLTEADDHHENLNWSRYQNDVNIINQKLLH